MSCNNCFNGCTETVSDQCVKYTGPNISALGINTGDSLLTVETAIFTFLTSTLDSTGIIPIIPENLICSLVSNYFPDKPELNLNDILTAIIQATCSLQTQVNSINSTLTTLNGNYTIGCLTGVSSNSGTHAILQAVITKLCSVDSSLSSLISSIPATYVAISNINSYIAAYLASLPNTNLVKNKMIPYVAVPYFGALSGPGSPNFDLSGAGTGDWIDIYLCNGANSFVPDLRGRTLVGSTAMNGGAFNPAVDPGVPGNPTIPLNYAYGTNTVQLTSNQIPAHTHAATSTVTDPGHTHTYTKPAANGSASGNADNHPDGPLVTATSSNSTTGITVATTISNNSTTNSAHANYQPSYGCYYIMYVPS